MDDRIRRDNSQNSENVNSNSPREFKSEAFDYKENISSSSAGDRINPTAQKVKRFEVHIPESEDFPAFRQELPVRPSAPARRSSPMPGQQVRPSSQGQPIRPQSAQNQPVRPSSMPGYAARPGAQPSAQAARPSAPRSSANAPVNGVRSSATAGSGAPNGQSAAKPASAKPQTANAKPSGKKKAPKRKKSRGDLAYNFAKGVLVTCVCFIFIATLTTLVSSVAFGFINDILVIDDENKGYSVVVEIPEGSEYADIFNILKENGLVNQPLLTDFFLKFRHYDYQAVYDDETGELLYDDAGEVLMEPVKYAPGVYYVYADSGIENILDSMLLNSNSNKDTVRLTFPEGWTIAEVFEKIEKYDVCEAEKLYANLDIVAEQYSFIKKLSDKEGRYLKAEGYLFPDTYDFFIGESASSVLKKLFNNFEAKWEKEYNARLKELGMSMEEIIIIASIIQCEAKDGSQMADISGVIHNRLENAASYPTLDMDSTADYINSLKTFNVLSDAHYSVYLESYNTYSKPGLTPGPICNPGASAIRAALYPTDSIYYFFCHGEDGAVYYAATATEHQENVQRVIYGVGG